MNRALISFVLFVALSFVNGFVPVAFAEGGIPLPTGANSYVLTAPANPLFSENPAEAVPVGFGPAANGESVVRIALGLEPFAGPADVYVAFIHSAAPGQLNVLMPDNSFVPFSTASVAQAMAAGSFPAGMLPWKGATTEEIDLALVDFIPSGSLPNGRYDVLVLATPVGQISSYYLWTSSFTLSTHTLLPPAGQVIYSAAETAALLANSDTAERGVWSVLANFGIGVYTADGTAVMAGSERSVDDFWLLDFEIPMLVDMVKAPAQSLEESFNPEIVVSGTRLGLDITALCQPLIAMGIPCPFPTELGQSTPYEGTIASTILEASLTLTDADLDTFLFQLLTAMGIDLTDRSLLYDTPNGALISATYSPFQAWLLFLDTFVTPNGSSVTPQAKRILGKAAVSPFLPKTALRAAPPEQCNFQAVGTGEALWGVLKDKLAGKVKEVVLSTILPGSEQLADVYPEDVVKAMNFSLATNTFLYAEPSTKTHRGHGGSGQPLYFTALALLNTNYGKEKSADKPMETPLTVQCGRWRGLKWFNGLVPIEDVPLHWSYPSALTQNGDLSVIPACANAGDATCDVYDNKTGPDGKRTVQFLPDRETADYTGRYGPLVSETGDVEVRFDLLQTYGEYANYAWWILDKLLPETESRTATVEYHEYVPDEPHPL